VVLWDVTPCRDVIGCKRFGLLYCFHLQGETCLSCRITTQRQDPEHHDLNFHRPEHLKSLSNPICFCSLEFRR